jgi:hypothetical protein
LSDEDFVVDFDYRYKSLKCSETLLQHRKWGAVMMGTSSLWLQSSIANSTEEKRQILALHIFDFLTTNCSLHLDNNVLVRYFPSLLIDIIAVTA